MQTLECGTAEKDKSALGKWQLREEANISEATMLKDSYSGESVNQKDLTL